MECWINLSDIGVTNNGFNLFDYWTSSGSSGSFSFHYVKNAADPTRDGRWIARLNGRNGFANQELIFPDIGDPNLNEWYHVALSRAGDNVAMYLNGVRNGPAIALPAGFDLSTSATAARFLYGKAKPPNGERYLIGVMDEMRICKEGLYTEAEYQPRTDQFPRT